MKRILIMSKYYKPVIGGIERVIENYVTGLKDKYELEMLVCQTKGKGKKEIIDDCLVTKATSYGIFRSVPISFDYFTKSKMVHDFDIVHIHIPFPLAVLSLLFRNYKGKIIISWHSEIVRQKFLGFFYKPIRNTLVRRADKILIGSLSLLNNSKVLQKRKEKCVLIPYAIQDDFVEETINDITKRNNQCEQTEVLFVGRLVYYKGCSVLLDAFKNINRNVRLTIVGDGPLKKQLDKKIRDEHMQDRVIIRDRVLDDELKELFNSSHIFVLPSITSNETYGLVQLEAMTYGLPVINTLLPTGVPEVSINGITGITVTPQNVEELRQALQTLIDDKDLRIKYGINARKRIEKEYRMQIMIDKIDQLYKTCV